MIIGILALQGNFKKHFDSFYKLNVKSIYVRTLEDLMKSDALVIPGGESTTITKLLKKNSLIKPLAEYSKIKNIFGTCAGSILMCNDINDKTIENIGCINVKIKRNAWGSQIHSFNNNIIIKNGSENYNYPGIFIRAPKIISYDNTCQLLGSIDNDKTPVLLRNKLHLIGTFHPELTDDLSIHKYFIKMIHE